MRTSNPERIAELSATGAWSGDTLHGLLSRHARERAGRLAVRDQPDREALTGEPPRSLNWSELAVASDNLAAQLRAAGLKAADRVLIQLPNITELVVLYYALSKLGAVASPVPVQYGSHELNHVAAAVDAAAVITSRRFRDRALAQEVRESLPQRRVLCFPDELQLDLQAGRVFEGIPEGDADRILTLCWTSGTTGTPKAVPRSHNMWLASGRCSIEACAYVADDVLLNPFPLVNMSSIGGFLAPAALCGCAIVLHHPLDPPLFLRQMQDEGISFTIAPPALLNQLAKSPEQWRQFNFGALRRVGSGSAPLAPWMIETFAEQFGVEVVNIYGSNEGIALFSTPETAPDPEIRATMFPRPDGSRGLRTRVADPESGQELVSPGERGELLVAGPTVFDGYFSHDNTDVFDEDGYFRTGDLVEICGDQGSYFRIVGRCKDIINRGGMKISPVELDVALERHPQVVEAAVCAYPDERLGEKICACLVMQAGVGLLDVADLQQYLLAAGFAKFKLPERVHELEQLPRNPLGKVQRFVLQELVGTQD